MARLPRYQESGLISADIPRMDFANVREQSKQAETIGNALTRISEFAFGQVQKQREQENKLLGIGLRMDLEMEAQVELSNISQRVKKGEVTDPKIIQETITALAQQQTKMLGRYSAEQAAGLGNSIMGQGRAILNDANDRSLKIYQAGKDVSVQNAILSNIVNLALQFRSARSFEGMNQAIIESRALFSAAALEATNPQEVLKKFEESVVEAQKSFVRDFINESEDRVGVYTAIKMGRSNNPVINEMIKKGLRSEVLVAADSAMEEYRKTVDNVSRFNVEQAKAVTVEWADAISSGNPEAIKKALSDTRMFDSANYEKRLNQFEATGGLFASNDNQLLVKNLDERLANPYGPNPVTPQELITNARNLTQATYSRYLDRVKSSADEQVKIVLNEAQSELGMTPGSVLIPDAQRKRAQAQLLALELQLIRARRADPNLNVSTWYSENKDKIFKPAAQKSDDSLATKVTGRSIKTIKGFTDAIRDAQRIGDISSANTLTLQRDELQAAIDQGLVDEQGKRKATEAAK